MGLLISTITASNSINEVILTINNLPISLLDFSIMMGTLDQSLSYMIYLILMPMVRLIEVYYDNMHLQFAITSFALR
jgi:hypothetical protein